MSEKISNRNLILWVLVIVLVLVAWATRYETVRLGDHTAYQLNRWTGSTRLLRGTTSREVKRQKLKKNSYSQEYVDE